MPILGAEKLRVLGELIGQQWVWTVLTEQQFVGAALLGQRCVWYACRLAGKWGRTVSEGPPD